MSDTTQDTTKANAAQTLIVNIIDKAWEYRWGIQLTYLVLYADTALAWSLHKNLLSITTSSSDVWGSVGGLLLGVTGFSLTVAVVVPLVSEILRILVIELLFTKLNFLFEDRKAGHNEVTLHDLHCEALASENGFLMEIYREKRATWVGRINHQLQLGTLLCGLTMLIIANIWSGHATGVTTLMLAIGSMQEAPIHWLLAALSSMAAIWVWITPIPSSYLFHPPLSQKLQEQ